MVNNKDEKNDASCEERQELTAGCGLYTEEDLSIIGSGSNIVFELLQEASPEYMVGLVAGLMFPIISKDSRMHGTPLDRYAVNAYLNFKEDEKASAMLRSIL